MLVATPREAVRAMSSNLASRPAPAGRNPQTLDRLHFVRWNRPTLPDGIDLEVNTAPTDQEDWHSVHDLSPGQRSTALLSLALAAGEEPRFIDQPEDDLDNRYIFAEVVQVLARVCQRRQVIVATQHRERSDPRRRRNDHGAGCRVR